MSVQLHHTEIEIESPARHGTATRLRRGALAASLALGVAGSLAVGVSGPAGAGVRTTSTLAPTITHVSPNYGPGSGGTVVTLEGTHLRQITSIKFGATRGKIVKVFTDDKIEVKSPKGNGPVDIVAKNTHGKSPVTPADQFDYQTTSS